MLAGHLRLISVRTLRAAQSQTVRVFHPKFAVLLQPKRLELLLFRAWIAAHIIVQSYHGITPIPGAPEALPMAIITDSIAGNLAE